MGFCFFWPYICLFYGLVGYFPDSFCFWLYKFTQLWPLEVGMVGHSLFLLSNIDFRKIYSVFAFLQMWVDLVSCENLWPLGQPYFVWILVCVTSQSAVKILPIDDFSFSLVSFVDRGSNADLKMKVSQKTTNHRHNLTSSKISFCPCCIWQYVAQDQTEANILSSLEGCNMRCCGGGTDTARDWVHYTVWTFTKHQGIAPDSQSLGLSPRQGQDKLAPLLWGLTWIQGFGQRGTELEIWSLTPRGRALTLITVQNTLFVDFCEKTPWLSYHFSG